VTILWNRLNDDVRNAPDELQWNHRLWDKGFRSDSDFEGDLSDAVYLEARLRTYKQALENMPITDSEESESTPMDRAEDSAEDEEKATD
jgi:hypothetical protein